jgi:hypothetical protein
LRFWFTLKPTYGFINPTQLAESYKKMTDPINFQYPIETFFKQIEDGVRYASAGLQPYMEAQYVNIALLLILNAGAVPEACREWKRRTPVNQTWGGLRQNFARSQHEQRIISNTTSSAGYHTANVAARYVQTALPADGGCVTAMANLATATSADRDTVAVLTKTIATLTDQLSAKDMWVHAKEAEIKHLVSGRAITEAGATAAPAAAYVIKSYKTKK